MSQVVIMNADTNEEVIELALRLRQIGWRPSTSGTAGACGDILTEMFSAAVHRGLIDIAEYERLRDGLNFTAVNDRIDFYDRAQLVRPL